MNYKRKKRHSSNSCGLCKWGKRFNVPKKDAHYFIEKEIDKEKKTI